MIRLSIARGETGLFPLFFIFFLFFYVFRTAIFPVFRPSVMNTLSGVSCFPLVFPFFPDLRSDFSFFHLETLYFPMIIRCFMHTLPCVSTQALKKRGFPPRFPVSSHDLVAAVFFSHHMAVHSVPAPSFSSASYSP